MNATRNQTVTPSRTARVAGGVGRAVRWMPQRRCGVWNTALLTAGVWWQEDLKASGLGLGAMGAEKGRHFFNQHGGDGHADCLQGEAVQGDSQGAQGLIVRRAGLFPLDSSVGMSSLCVGLVAIGTQGNGGCGRFGHDTDRPAAPWSEAAETSMQHFQTQGHQGYAVRKHRDYMGSAAG